MRKLLKSLGMDKYNERTGKAGILFAVINYRNAGLLKKRKTLNLKQKWTEM